MKIGFIQDIHGNMEALTAVLKELYQKHQVSHVMCLGDMLSYGPNPNEVVQTIYNNNINFIMGDDEYTLLYPELFYPNMNDLSRNCAIWTRNQIDPSIYEYIKNNQFNQQRGDNRCLYGEDFIGVHCSIKDILPQYSEYGIYLDNDEKARDNFSILMANKKNIMFYGHTHIPHIYAYSSFTGKFAALPVTSNFTKIKFLEKHYYLINFGSVSFSRDFKPLASYGVLDADNRSFEIHRIKYDIDTTLMKLEAIQAPKKVISWHLHGGFKIIDK